MNHAKPALSAARQFSRQNLLSTCLVVVVVGAASSLSADEPRSPQFLLEWGSKGDKPGEFYSPISIAVNRKDEVFVTDLNNARVQRFSTAGEFLSVFELPLDAPPRKSCIIGGLAVDENDQIYLAFMNQHRIGVYDQSGKLIREWGKRGTEDGEFHQPGGIVLAGGGIVYIADQCNHRIQKFTINGKFLGKWGEHGSQPGEFGGVEHAGSRFGGPHFLAMDSQGRLYTTEGVAGRVQQFSPDGKALLAWGSKGDEPGGFGEYQTGFSKNSFGPIGILVDRFDRVWVSSLNDQVQLYTPEGKFLFGIGGSGDKPGEFARPHGMALDSQGRLYVADAGNQRIQKFAIPEP